MRVLWFRRARTHSMRKIAASTPTWWLSARYFRMESTARKLPKNHTRIPIVVSFSSEGSSYHQKICTRKASTVGYGRALSGHLVWWRTWRARFQVFSYLRQAYQMSPIMTMSGDTRDRRAGSCAVSKRGRSRAARRSSGSCRVQFVYSPKFSAPV